MWYICSMKYSVPFSCLVMSDSLRPHGLQHARLPCPSPTPRLYSNLKLMSIALVMPSNHLILCCPLFLPLSIFPSIRVFSNESVLCTRWPKYWNFSFNISPSNEYSGLSSFRIDWLDLLAAQGTLKSLLQHHSSKAPILQHSALFIVQISQPYMTVFDQVPFVFADISLALRNCQGQQSSISLIYFSLFAVFLAK